MEGTLYIREPKKSWKQSHVCLKNGFLLVNKERGVTTLSVLLVSTERPCLLMQCYEVLFQLKSCFCFVYQLISKATKAEQWSLHKLTLYVGVPAEKATKGVDTR